MSYFDNLSQETQNLIMLNFEFFGKKLIIGVAIFAALFYIFYLRKNQKDTPYHAVATVRSILYIVSITFLFASPLLIFYLYPQIALDEILRYVFIFYLVSFAIIGIVVFVNIVIYGPMIITRIGGFNPQSKNTDKVMRDIWGKNVKYFKNIYTKFFAKGRNF